MAPPHVDSRLLYLRIVSELTSWQFQFSSLGVGGKLAVMVAVVGAVVRARWRWWGRAASRQRLAQLPNGRSCVRQAPNKLLEPPRSFRAASRRAASHL
jgi:hypothetical protein